MNRSSTATPSSIFDLLSGLADATRSRLLLVMERRDFTVSELCTILQLPQSTVSRHLKLLSDEGWLVSRAEGTSRRYRMTVRGLDEAARELWQLVREEAAGLPAARQDAMRMRSVLAERHSRSREFFASAAGEWDGLRADMFGRRVDLHALVGLADERWVVGDLGCGTGRVSEILAPFCARVVAVDGSPEMLAAARERLASRDDVEVREGSLEALPVEDDELDVAVLFLVLHHVGEPGAVLAETARVLRPGGRLLIADMTPHDRRAYEMEMGHAWLGFSEEQIRGWLEDAGFEAPRYHALPPDPEASGPAVFVATGRRPRGP